MQYKKKENMEKKKVMISQPMKGKTEEEIKEQKEKATKFLEEQGYEIIDTYFSDEWEKEESLEEKGVIQKPLYFLSKSIEKMSLCDAVYFCKGWANTRGCTIEYEAAVNYGLKVIFESITKEEFMNNILEGIKKYPSDWRYGQKVFNFIDEKFGVARMVQYDDHIDCFYNDSNVDDFIDCAYKAYICRFYRNN